MYQILTRKKRDLKEEVAQKEQEARDKQLREQARKFKKSEIDEFI